MSVLLLSGLHPRYLLPLKRLGAVLHAAGVTVRVRGPDAWYKEDVLADIARGYACVVYFGHSVNGAWCAYGGLTSLDLVRARPARPSGWVIALTCCALRRGRTVSLTKAFLDAGWARHVVGTDRRIRYEDGLQSLEELGGLLCSRRGLERVRAWAERHRLLVR